MSSNGIYVYDIKHGTPKTYEEAHEILVFVGCAVRTNFPTKNQYYGKFGAHCAPYIFQAA